MKVWSSPNVELASADVDARDQLRLDDIGLTGLDRIAASLTTLDMTRNFTHHFDPADSAASRLTGAKAITNKIAMIGL
jgi:hypothetical protein